MDEISKQLIRETYLEKEKTDKIYLPEEIEWGKYDDAAKMA